ncbi:hypothetical protein ACOKFD_07960 [Flagellimonas sp. S174]|uniref:hypothetical protein n=1 Tax=Flagellimonas sp. S174 TaxID=3410790 RepID=UPI003BF5F15A
MTDQLVQYKYQKKGIWTCIKVFFVLSTVALFCSCEPKKSPEKMNNAVIGEWKPVQEHLLGANANLISFNDPWNMEGLVEVTKKTEIRTLRYPGGTIGNYWDWDIGAIDRDVPDSLMIKWVVENDHRASPDRYTIESLARMYQQTGIVPVFMLNMLSKDLQHSVRNLKKAQSLGIPIKYIEMGNELYFNIPFPLLRYPTPEVYGETCQIWIDELKKEFPDASFAVVGTNMTRHARQVDWNKRVLEKCKNADAITIHLYSPSGLDGRLERKKIAPGKEGLGASGTATRTAPKEIGERQKWELELLKDKQAYSNMFTTASKNLKKIDGFYVPKAMDLWVTEFNIRDDNSVVLHSWAQTLILSKYLFKFLESDVELSSMHNLTGNLFGMVHTDTLNYQQLKSQSIKSMPYTLSSGGMVTKLFGDAMKGKVEGAVLNFDTVSMLTDDRGDQVENMKGYIFKHENEKTAIIANYDVTGQEIEFSTIPDFKGKMHIYASSPSKPVIGLENILVDEVDFVDTIKLPPYSIAIIKFQ